MALHERQTATALYIRQMAPEAIMKTADWALDVLLVETAEPRVEIEVRHDHGELSAWATYDDGGSHEGDWDEELDSGWYSTPFAVASAVVTKLNEINESVERQIEAELDY